MISSQSVSQSDWSNSQVVGLITACIISVLSVAAEFFLPPPPIMLKKKERRAAEAALDAKVLAAMEDVRRAYESRFFRAPPPHLHPLVIPRGGILEPFLA